MAVVFGAGEPEPGRQVRDQRLQVLGVGFVAVREVPAVVHGACRASSTGGP
ncbi:hypothetical protein [Amycolatopsis sp. NBC_01286]|uniref:hypothetical protein n=1 Tax=Amycolatopsis sp. NBC_01286 TaxID=2903560 RepID=UPI002E0D92C7|nr:hypothetical protein OG570_02275 [Amycolatopsis sp. NBC_01286]